MAQTKHELFPDNRLAILQAAQTGRVSDVGVWLDQQPELIHAKTTTSKATLLHLAAQTGNMELCQLLLSRHHETNPVDKEGKTPYQRATMPHVQDLIVQAHTDVLFERYLTSYAKPIPERSFIRSIQKGINILKPTEFFEHPLLEGAGQMGSDTFGVTSLSPPSSKNYQLLTLFREDAIMTPYLGELLVAHENEQATQFIDLLAASKDGFVQAGSFPLSELNRFEVQSYLKGISTLFTQYPFLEGYPQPSDKPDVVHAKKLIIAFELTGFIAYYQQCTQEQLNYLSTIDSYARVLDLATRIIRPENSVINLAIVKEMNTIYDVERSSGDEMRRTIS